MFMMLFPTTPGRPSEVSVSQKVAGYLGYLEVLFRTHNLLQCALIYNQSTCVLLTVHVELLFSKNTHTSKLRLSF